MKKLLLTLLFFPLLSFGQSKKQKKLSAIQQKENQQVTANLEKHVLVMQSFLQNHNHDSNDSMMLYIGRQFSEDGLKTVTANAFSQKLSINEGRQIYTGTYLRINGKTLELNRDFYPLPFSASKQVTGMPAMALHEKNLPWFDDLKNLLPQKMNDANVYKLIANEAQRAAAKGATALIIYNTESDEALPYFRNDSTATAQIPILFITAEALKSYFTDHSDLLDMEVNVLVKEKKYFATNFLGLIDNAASSTILVSTILSGVDDDSAKQKNSLNQLAMLFEWAKRLSGEKFKNSNYVLGVFGHPLLRDLYVQRQKNLLLEVRLDKLSDLSSDDFITHVRMMEYLVKAPGENTKMEDWTNDDAISISIDKDPVNKNMPPILVVKQNNTVANALKLGIIADEKYNGEGLKIRKVLPEKIGAAAGLQQGDILIAIGSGFVLNSQSYLQALSSVKVR